MKTIRVQEWDITSGPRTTGVSGDCGSTLVPVDNIAQVNSGTYADLEHAVIQLKQPAGSTLFTRESVDEIEAMLNEAESEPPKICERCWGKGYIAQHHGGGGGISNAICLACDGTKYEREGQRGRCQYCGAEHVYNKNICCVCHGDAVVTSGSVVSPCPACNGVQL